MNPELSTEANGGNEGAVQPLRAFVVTTHHAEASVLVFAPNRNRARSIAHGTDWFADEEWTDLRVKRSPLADVHAARFGEGALECATADECRILRDLGWFEIDSGTEECSECGRHQWDCVPESHLSDREEDRICAGCLALKPSAKNAELSTSPS